MAILALPPTVGTLTDRSNCSGLTVWDVREMPESTYSPKRFARCGIVSMLLLLSACLSGCDQNDRLGSVHGVVRLDGRPVIKGTVRFVPLAGRAASGEIQEDGTFTLGTFGESDGALVGLHQVAIIAYEAGPVQRTAGGRPPPAVTKPLVPKRYMSPGTSRLSFEVKPDANNAEFDLTSKE